MKPKTMILMGLAVACGLGTSFMTSRLLAERQNQEQDKEYVKVLVAKKNIDMATSIRNAGDLFEEKAYEKGQEPKTAIVVGENQFASICDSLKGRQLKLPRRTGDPISMEDLFDKENSGISGALPEGHRAIGLRVNMESIAGGFASLPHSRVDLISTVRRGNDRDSYSRILLENVLVLAADTVTKRDEGSNAMPASVVTVALTPEQVLKVNVAREIGSLSLALRRFGDQKLAHVDRVTVEQVNNNSTREPGKGEDHEDDIKTSTSVAGGSLLPRGSKNGTPGSVNVAAGPRLDARTHILRVIEGDRERRTEYTLDLNGDVIQHQVIRSELDVPVVPQPAPVPGATATPRPQDATPAVPGTSATPPAVPGTVPPGSSQGKTGY